jgi:hypothetical protein
MWNLRSLKISVMLVASGVALVAALPAKAQQVVLTPGGTAFMMPPVVETVATPIATPQLPPSTLPVQPGKSIYNGIEVEILADNDARIPENDRFADPKSVYVVGLMQDIPFRVPIEGIGKSAPTSKTMEEIMGLPPGSLLQPPMISAPIVLDKTDPRIPQGLTELGDYHVWAIDAKSLDPSVAPGTYQPYVTDRNGYIMLSREQVVVLVQEVKALSEKTARYNAVFGSQDATEARARLVLLNPELYTLRNLETSGQPVKDIKDDQGNIVVSRQWIINARIVEANNYLTGVKVEGIRNAEFTFGDALTYANNIFDYIPERLSDLNYSGYIPPAYATTDGILGNHSLTAQPSGMTPLGINPIAGSGAEFFSAVTTSGSGGISGSAISSPLTAFPTVSQSVIANQITSPVTSVTVQPSRNPTADFATTRSAPRNSVPEQLNQGVIDSPLSSSRIFPGMR